jgi:hypothetical protein
MQITCELFQRRALPLPAGDSDTFAGSWSRPMIDSTFVSDACQNDVVMFSFGSLFFLYGCLGYFNGVWERGAMHIGRKKCVFDRKCGPPYSSAFSFRHYQYY